MGKMKYLELLCIKYNDFKWNCSKSSMGICYQDGSTNTCKRCNFNLCDSCTTKFYHNVKYGTLINQCGQCNPGTMDQTHR